MKNVFIASRFKEFEELKKNLTKEFKEFKLITMDLDDNKAVSQTALNRSLDSISKADIIIFLLGDTYGEKLKEYNKSITHLEYEEALHLNKTIFIFGIGDLYSNNEIKFSEDSVYKAWQIQLLDGPIFSKFSKNEKHKNTVSEIVFNIYSEIDKVWYDIDTGLTWQKVVEHDNENGGRYNWFDSFYFCDSKNREKYGDFNDWRIPTFDELKTLLVDEKSKNPYSYDETTYIKKPLLYSMKMKHSRFWSSTSNPRNKDNAYGIHFGRRRSDSEGENIGKNKRDKTRYIRCVRGTNHEKDWEKIKESIDIEDYKKFLKKQRNDDYKNKALDKIKVFELEYINNTTYEIKKLEFKKMNSSYSNGVFLKAIKDGFFNECTFEALDELKRNMQLSKDWKEISTAKNPDKDKKYKRTHEVLNLLNSNRDK